MTLRLTNADAASLREFAEATGRSMQDVALTAIRDYVGQRTAARDAVLKRIVDEDAALLDLLSQ